MAEYKKEIGVAVMVAVVLAAVVGIVAIYTVKMTEHVVDVQITSGNLTVNGNSSVLQVTLLEVGNSYIGSATVYVNGTVIGIPPASEYEPPGNIILNIQPREQGVLVLTIPNSTLSVQAGRTYSVLVYAWLGPPGERASSGLPESVNITAT